jgi:2-keto-4-pentenoate hydratase
MVTFSVTDSATGAAVQGHPAEALALAANSLGERGIEIAGQTQLRGQLLLEGQLGCLAAARRTG